MPSTRPYLIRALHEWCTDNGFSPYLAVHVDASVQVPLEFVKNNEIVLNVSYDATGQLQLGNDFIEFKARFGGIARDIIVPVDHVVAIYARENGQGMAFPPPAAAAAGADGSPSAQGAEVGQSGKSLQLVASNPQDSAVPAPGPDGEDDPPPEPGGGRPALKRVK